MSASHVGGWGSGGGVGWGSTHRLPQTSRERPDKNEKTARRGAESCGAVETLSFLPDISPGGAASLNYLGFSFKRKCLFMSSEQRHQWLAIGTETKRCPRCEFSPCRTTAEFAFRLELGAEIFVQRDDLGFATTQSVNKIYNKHVKMLLVLEAKKKWDKETWPLVKCYFSLFVLTVSTCIVWLNPGTQRHHQTLRFPLCDAFTGCSVVAC